MKLNDTFLKVPKKIKLALVGRASITSIPQFSPRTYYSIKLFFIYYKHNSICAYFRYAAVLYYDPYLHWGNI